MPVLGSECIAPRQPRRAFLSPILFLLLYIGGCASPWVTVAPALPESVERLGPAKAEACGDLYLFTTPTQFIPGLWNERLGNAYDEAVASVPGATALADVTYQESWYWWVLASRRCVRISGEAVR